jgi:hypothetical protein
MTTDNFCFYLQNRLIQTSQSGGQQNSDTSPFSIPWIHTPKLTQECSFPGFDLRCVILGLIQPILEILGWNGAILRIDRLVIKTNKIFEWVAKLSDIDILKIYKT